TATPSQTRRGTAARPERSDSARSSAHPPASSAAPPLRSAAPARRASAESSSVRSTWVWVTEEAMATARRASTPWTTPEQDPRSDPSSPGAPSCHTPSSRPPTADALVSPQSATTSPTRQGTAARLGRSASAYPRSSAAPPPARQASDSTWVMKVARATARRTSTPWASRDQDPRSAPSSSTSRPPCHKPSSRPTTTGAVVSPWSATPLPTRWSMAARPERSVSARSSAHPPASSAAPSRAR
uniref:Uncharacterized protein n=1 Tax=Aegilops tauschii subsp. strangulata TaxID=200361 RepID=A0A453LBD0_AEGTS